MSLIKRKCFRKRNVSQCQVIFAFTGLSLSNLNHLKYILAYLMLLLGNSFSDRAFGLFTRLPRVISLVTSLVTCIKRCSVKRLTKLSLISCFSHSFHLLILSLLLFS